MNIHIKCVSRDEYKRLKEGHDTVEGFKNTTKNPILVISRDSSIDRGDLVGIQTIVDDSAFVPYREQRIAPHIQLVQIVDFVSPQQWFRHGVQPMYVRPIDLSEYEKLARNHYAETKVAE